MTLAQLFTAPAVHGPSCSRPQLFTASAVHCPSQLTGSISSSPNWSSGSVLVHSASTWAASVSIAGHTCTQGEGHRPVSKEESQAPHGQPASQSLGTPARQTASEADRYDAIEEAAVRQPFTAQRLTPLQAAAGPASSCPPRYPAMQM